MTPPTVEATILVNVPVLNEISNIGPLVGGIQQALSGLHYVLLFVDDGSTDGTLEFIQSLIDADERVQLLQRRKTRYGCQRGGALFDGMTWALSHTTCTVFVEMDGDLSHRPDELRAGLAELTRTGSDVVIASKYLPGSRTINRPVTRRAVSAICNTGVRLLINGQLSDYSNGYRFYTRAVAETIARTEIDYTSPIYLTEFVAVCLRQGFRVSEFASTYVGRNEGLSKLRVIDLVKATLAIVEIAGRYHGTGFRNRSPEPVRERAEGSTGHERCVICHAALNGSIAVRLTESWLGSMPELPDAALLSSQQLRTSDRATQRLRVPGASLFSEPPGTRGPDSRALPCGLFRARTCRRRPIAPRTARRRHWLQ